MFLGAFRTIIEKHPSASANPVTNQGSISLLLIIGVLSLNTSHPLE